MGAEGKGDYREGKLVNGESENLTEDGVKRKTMGNERWGKREREGRREGVEKITKKSIVRFGTRK